MSNRIQYTIDTILLSSVWVLPEWIQNIDLEQVADSLNRIMQLTISVLLLLTALRRYLKSKKDKKNDSE